ncbi:hypothetical protein [Thiolapillus sp.]
MNPLKTYIERTLAAKGMRRSDLARRMGYRNVNKALRRLDRFIDELADAKRITPQLAVILGNEAALIEAVRQRQEQLDREARARFKPWLQILPSSTPSPLFVVALCPWMLNLPLPEDIASWPEARQFDHVRRLFRQNQEEYPLGWRHGRGFIYRREYGDSLEFDEQGRLLGKVDRPWRPGRLRVS